MAKGGTKIVPTSRQRSQNGMTGIVDRVVGPSGLWMRSVKKAKV